MSGDGNTICGDTNECAIGIADCDYNAKCINHVGSYSCQCNPGFEGDGRVCQNAVTCANITCNENAECVESNGLASCRCVSGFTGNGQICQPKVGHSCHIANNCSPYGICQINLATEEYQCLCLPGFEGDGYRCTPNQEKTTEIQITGDQNITTATEENIPPTTEVNSNSFEYETTETLIQTTTDRVPKNCNSTSCWCPDAFVIDEETQYCVRIGEHATQHPKSKSVH